MPRVANHADRHEVQSPDVWCSPAGTDGVVHQTYFDPAMTDHHAETFWETRYAGEEHIWSGEPNQALIDAVTDFNPGRALDLGCGEGGDSIWLAQHGWNVTAVDIATTAISRAQDLATRRGISGGRIVWVVADLASWRPTEAYELVSACFLQSPLAFPRIDVLRGAASAVAPGGHLLVVAHADAPPWSEDHEHAHHPCMDPTTELVDLELEATAWATLVRDIRPRPATGPHGERATLNDSVLLLRRR
jgi:SAM-dependent methyltransferase